MIPLFGEPEAGGKRDTLEGRFIWLAIEALQLGTSVVLDFGVWSRDERSLLRWLAGSVGASCEVVYVQVDRATQRERIWQRWTRTPQETFVMADAEIDTWRAQFQVPDDAELGGKVADPPEGWRTWFDWAARRWPSEISQLSPDGASPARPGSHRLGPCPNTRICCDPSGHAEMLMLPVATAPAARRHERGTEAALPVRLDRRKDLNSWR
jgi:hypothetical protein